MASVCSEARDREPLLPLGPAAAGAYPGEVLRAPKPPAPPHTPVTVLPWDSALPSVPRAPLHGSGDSEAAGGADPLQLLRKSVFNGDDLLVPISVRGLILCL